MQGATRTPDGHVYPHQATNLPLFQVYSLDYARTRLANDAADSHHNRQFTGLWSVYKKTYATDGLAGLYRGFNVSVVSGPTQMINASMEVLPSHSKICLPLHGKSGCPLIFGEAPMFTMFHTISSWWRVAALMEQGLHPRPSRAH